MKRYAGIFFFVFCCCIKVSSFAQNTGIWSSQFNLPELTAFLTFPEPSEKIEQTLEEERNSPSELKSLIYAVGIATSLNPATSGQWDTIPSKGYVWRTGIHAENAQSLNIFIENYRMQPGMALYVYNPSMDNIIGPFDSGNNVNGGVLPVQSLPGDKIIIEWNIPLQALPRNDFTITNIGYGFRSTTGSGKIIALSEAASCNIDVNCRTGNHWQREKRSVVRMETLLLNGKTQYCTGTLVNQAVEASRKKPYILTANHCISDQKLAERTTFVFGYEKPYCDGPNISVPATKLSGANLIATRRSLDFTLLELHNNVTDAHQPFYAGWNTLTGNNTPQSAVGIHHPEGDAKKISVENDPLTTGTFNDVSTDLHCDVNAHWIVRRWDEGVTQGGSSGSPIFDMEHRIVGTLSGGQATCSNPINDYYSKFSEQWNKYSNEEERLKQWLDPDYIGVTSLGGYDPIAPYEGRYDMFGNIGKNETEILLKSGEWGYLTSQNDRQWTSFAEKIKNDSVAVIIGIEAHVAKVAELGAYVQFSIWHGNEFPVVAMRKKNMLVTQDYENYPIHVYFDRAVEVSGDFFIGYSLDLDTFAVYHSTIRPYSGVSAMYVEESNGTWMALEDYVPPIYTSLAVKAIGKFGKQTASKLPPTQKNLKVIYQQGSGVLDIYFEEEISTLKVELYDTSGKLVLTPPELKGSMKFLGDIVCSCVEIDVSNLPPGVYLIQTFDKEKRRSGKFVKIQ